MTPTPAVKVLLVDDRKENLHALDSLLRVGARKNLEIFHAFSGNEALELLLRHDFAVALLDVQMPEMNGLELAELMRGVERTKMIPIIFVTAGAIDPLNTFQGYEAGAVDFLYKPLDPRIVRGKVDVFVALQEQRLIIEEQMKRLTESLRLREDFLSIASHELRTPLTSLRLQLQALAKFQSLKPGEMPDPERFGKALAVVNRQFDKLTSLINELLDVSRIQSGKLTLDRKAADLSALVRDVVDRFAPELERVGVKAVLELQDALVVPCDAFRIEQVVVNLVSNVLKYAPRGEVRLKTEMVDRGAVLKVTDSGPGIAPDRLKHVFNRFERVTDDRLVSGLGLGLYIVKQVVESHQGTVTVESELGKGSVFTVNLPL